MEGFLSRAAVSKKPTSTLYDDVFGGPPKFDRRRDYAEIFGDLKSSCSIPFLSLGEDDSAFDFGAGAGIDYDEVFGGFDFGDFAIPYEELVLESKRTKDEATFSFQAKEASSQHSNMCPVAPPEDNKFTSVSNCPADSMFNLSYSKINLGSNQETCGTTHVAELLAVPGYSIVVDDSMLAFSSRGSDDPCNMVQCGSEMKNLVKSPTRSSDNGSRGSEFDLKDSQIQNASGCADYENDIANFNYHSRSSSCHSVSSMDAPCKVTKYVSASDVSLRTKPLRAPPPSRPPPKLGHTIGGSTSNVSSYVNYSNDVSAKVVSGEQKHISEISSKGQRDHKASTESNTNFSGVEIDISSAAAASAAAAIKEAMEIAEARIKIAKESLERKRDYLNNGRTVASADMPPNERKVDKISRFSDTIKHRTIVKENNQTVKLSSQKTTEVKLVATGTTGSAASLADMLMQKTIVSDDKEADKIVSKEKTEVWERTVHQTKEVQQMVSGSDIKSLRSMTQVEGEPGNGNMNQGYFEIVNNKKKLINADFFELETVGQQTEPMIKNNDSSDTVNVNAAFPSDVARHNNLEDNCIRSEMGENVARQDNDHKEEQFEEIHNTVPDASRSDKFVIELEHTTTINEEGSKEFEEAQNVIEELKVLGACEQASASVGSKCKQELFGSSEPGTKGEERVSDATFATGDCEETLNSFAECRSGREENTILDKFENTRGSEENDCPVADATCEPCERGEKITVSSEVATSVANEINAPYETSKMRMETNEEAIPTGSCEKATFREINTEGQCKVKESRVTQEQEESGIANMDQIPITIAKNEIRLEAEIRTSQVENEISNQDEGQEVTQQFQAKISLQEECAERKTENADVEVKLSYNSYNSEEEISSIGNFEEHREEVHSLDTTFNADASPEVLQRPLDEQLNIQQAALLERRGNILGSTADVRESCTIVSEKANGNTKIEVKLKDRRLEKEREPAKDEARKLNEEREREREREKDRIGVERATQEAREAKERSEKFAVERMTADFRQRAFKEAREKAEKASAEAHERLLAEKAREAVLRAERAAVERATAEARERLVERALAEKAAMDAKESTGKYSTKSSNKDGPHAQYQNGSSSSNSQGDDEPVLRCKARMDRHRRTSERAAKALAEMNTRDILAQREQAERNRLAEYLDADVKRWSNGKEGNLRALLSTLQYILGPESGWQPIPLTDVITAVAVKKAYRKATLCVHPDKLQQRGASIQQKYICEKVFDLLKEAWNKFNSQGR